MFMHKIFKINFVDIIICIKLLNFFIFNIYCNSIPMKLRKSNFGQSPSLASYLDYIIHNIAIVYNAFFKRLIYNKDSSECHIK
jgi:hypothetical protein